MFENHPYETGLLSADCGRDHSRRHPTGRMRLAVGDEEPKAFAAMAAYIGVALMAFILVAFAGFLIWHPE